ncbi:MAG: 50S ribosomal protein L13 [Clostridia bacterium]|nr:50S ribosomal protein L13 [Clostridia bacterium]
MKTFMQKPENVERKWYVVDATNMPLGRLASQVADILTGKNKPTFTPHVDSGDHVIVINSDKAVLTGKKLTQKMLRSHSGYIGGLKETDYKTVMENKSDVAVMHAVKGMLPKTSLGRKMFTRLRVYKNAEHNHEAQQPVAVSLKGVRQ